VSIVGGYRGVTVKVQARTLMSLAREFTSRPLIS